MRLPSINQYIDTINSPFGLFKTIGGIEVDRDCYERARFISGNSAVVFKIFIAGRAYQLKCYIKPVQSGAKKYEYIHNIVASSDFIVDARLLESEIFVYDYCGGGSYFDVVLAPWVEGHPLDAEIRWAAERNDRHALGEFAAKFDRIALEMIQSEWAHGDIKPDNIIVDPNGNLFLIDYDALFIPSLTGNITSEIGTKPFQHPARDREMYDKHIDDYSIAMISVSLHALAQDPSLYEHYHQNDSIIMDASQLAAGECGAFDKIIAMWSSCGDSALYRLTQLLRSDSPYLSRLEGIMTMLVHELPQTIWSQDSEITHAAPISEPQSDTTPDELTPIQVDGLWGYADSCLNIVIEPIFDSAQSFHSDLAAVTLGNAWHFVDRSGNLVINCSEYTQVKPFYCGLAAVKHSHLWGYIDTAKREVIAPCYQMASSFREDLAVVRHNSKYGYINLDGTWHIEPQYDYATNFRDQRAEVEKGGKVFYIDKLGVAL